MSIQKSFTLETIKKLDKLTESLSKAIAISQLLSTDGQNVEGFQCGHDVVMNAIWDLCDHLDNAKNELRGI